MALVCITGASSGIGEEFAAQFAKKGYALLLVARNEQKLRGLAAKYPHCEIFPCDLGKEEEVKRLIDRLKEEEDLRFMINNAGFGSAGEFEEDVPENDLQMIGVNVRAVHLLTHAALLQMEKKNRGTILNVASIAGLMPGGPFMATYYATKAYVVSLTSAIAQELRRKKSRIQIFALCPGPVDTNFNRVAGVKFALPGISAKTCVSEALAGMKRGSVILVPGRLMRISSVLARLLPRGFVLKLISGAQKRKLGR